MLTHKYLVGRIGNPPSVYRTWLAMKNRCLNKRGPDYKNYGGRGITVCEEWKNSFVKFLEDMGEKPNGTSLDRIDNNKGYYKKNCRWATRNQQANNTRDNLKIKYKGKLVGMTELGKELGIKRKTAYWRVSNGWNINEVINGERDIYKKRNELIFKLRKEGLTQQEIGDKVGLSDSRVGDILKFVNKKCSAE